MPRVAVIDDDPALLRLMSAPLTERGWDVLTCPEGGNAFPLIKDEQPDLILLDLWLETPTSGWALLRRLSGDPATRDIPVLVYSGGPNQVGDKDAWLNDRGIAVVPTGSDLGALSDQVEAILSQQPVLLGGIIAAVGKESDVLSPPLIVAGDAEVLHIQLLGRFHVSIGARIIDPSEWPLRKAESLVKLLALIPQHRLHREQLMDILWPTLEAKAATNNFHRTLHVARHVLEPTLPLKASSSYLHLYREFLSFTSPGPLWIDIEAFQAAGDAARLIRSPAAYEDALQLYGGVLLPEDRYEDWTTSDRDRLTHVWSTLLVGLAHAREQRGEIDLSIAALRRLVDSDPADEEMQAALMRLLARSGQRRQALRQYQNLRGALRREYDAEPAPDTEALEQQIRGRNI